mmetsp:Transcript_13541/g.27691  ORF Transcript_13541/g.27691 Transcript_13541/m.27691 type:complete len:398 (-) Transcript_13541:3026-4219(-)
MRIHGSSLWRKWCGRARSETRAAAPFLSGRLPRGPRRSEQQRRRSSSTWRRSLDEQHWLVRAMSIDVEPEGRDSVRLELERPIPTPCSGRGLHVSIRNSTNLRSRASDEYPRRWTALGDVVNGSDGFSPRLRKRRAYSGRIVRETDMKQYELCPAEEDRQTITSRHTGTGTQDVTAPKNLSVIALASESQRNFDAAMLPSVPGFGDLRGRIKKKKYSAFADEIFDNLCAATDPFRSREDLKAAKDEMVKFAARDIQGSAYLCHALEKRFKSRESRTLLLTLDVLESLMRRIPYFYRYIANKKFFDRLWSLALDDNLDEPFQRSNEVSQRILLLVRSWAEEFEPVIGAPRNLDRAAEYIIESYEQRSIDFSFPEVPTSKVPFVFPVDPATDKVIPPST